eukprot:CAMPEP_0195090370 /NCGR_PEP_ID=MMETSP0448-20130528/29376_1 /TAXON_ID=66468 /ORGANISM="Heterocapsa triquestra, Strain CCMP 448" /LENGTH=109 /DNA_ID=CAMNT_0040124191 /DNA_START=109 /DNA_END=436 /DNA_ORIENTATION=+
MGWPAAAAVHCTSPSSPWVRRASQGLASSGSVLYKGGDESQQPAGPTPSGPLAPKHVKCAARDVQADRAREQVCADRVVQDLQVATSMRGQLGAQLLATGPMPGLGIVD